MVADNQTTRPYKVRHTSRQPDGSWYAEAWTTTFEEWWRGDQTDPVRIGRGATREEAMQRAISNGAP